MSKIGKVLSILIVVVLLNVGGSYAQMGMMGSGMMGQGMMGQGMMGSGMMSMMQGLSPGDSYLYYADKLELSVSQIRQLKTLRSDYRKSLIDRTAKLFDLRTELFDLYNNEEASYKSIRKKLREIEKVNADREDVYYDILEKAENILTTEQLKKMRSLQFSTSMLKEKGGEEKKESKGLMQRMMGR